MIFKNRVTVFFISGFPHVPTNLYPCVPKGHRARNCMAVCVDTHKHTPFELQNT